MNAADFRRIALSLEGAEEGWHMGSADFRVGGAVRYRIYSAWGLTAIDVAKICFIAGLTFWLGNVAVLGLGIAYEPQAASAIDQLPRCSTASLRSVRSACLLLMSLGFGSSRASSAVPTGW